MAIIITPLSFFIGGFMTVWSFRYITKSQKTAGFEYFGLSLFFGLILFVLVTLTNLNISNILVHLLPSVFGSIAGIMSGALSISPNKK